MLAPTLLAVSALAARSAAGQALDDAFVCAQVVIAVDASTNTEDGSFERQIAALTEALRRPRFAAAVQDCLPGTVGLAIIAWSGQGQQVVCHPWTMVQTPPDVERVTEGLRRCPRLGGSTDVGGALGAALDLLRGSPFDSHYRIVYLLTNGRTDEGRETALRDIRGEAEVVGVTVTGHVLLRRASFWNAPKNRLDPFHRYVDREVSVGPRSFTSASDVGQDAREVLAALVWMLRQELQ